MSDYIQEDKTGNNIKPLLELTTDEYNSSYNTALEILIAI